MTMLLKDDVSIDLLQELFFALPTGILLLDEHFTIRFWNQQIKDWLGLSGKKEPLALSRVVPDNVYQDMVRWISSRNHPNPWFEFELSRRRGEKRVFRVQKKTIHQAGQTYTGLFFTDATQLKETQELLDAERQLFIGGPAVVFKWKSAWEPALYVSPNVEKLYGYKPEEFTGGKIIYYDIVHPDDVSRVLEEARHYAREKRPFFEQEYRLFTKDGRMRWVHDFTTIRRDATSNIEYYYGYIIDITDRVESEQKVKFLADLRYLVAEISTEIIKTDPVHMDGVIQKILRLLGEFAGVDRSYVFLYDEKKKDWKEKYEWCAPGIESKFKHMVNIPGEQVWKWMKRLSRTEIFSFSNYSELKTVSEFELKLLKKQKVKSLLVIPLVVRKSLIGFLGFDSVREERVWTENRWEPLKLVGVILSNALDRKEAEIALREREERYRVLFDLLPYGGEVLDVNGTIVDCSASTERLLGYSKEELIGRKITEFMEPESVKRFEERFRNLSQCQGEVLEVQMRHKNGQIVQVLRAAQRLIDNHGRVTGVLVLSMDISDRKRAERALQESEQKYRLLAENINDIIFLMDARGKLLFISPSVHSNLGYTPEEMLRLPLSRLVARSSYLKAFRMFRTYFDTARSGKPVEIPPVECRLIHKDGSIRWGELKAKIIPYQPAETVIIQGTIRDITERKRAEILRQIMFNIAQAVTTTENIDELYQVIEQELTEVLNTRNFFIALYNEEKNELYFPFMKDEKDSFGRISAHKTLSELVIRENRPLLMHENEIRELAEKGVIRIVGSLSKVWLGVPLQIEDKVIGIIAIQDYEKSDALTESDLELLRFVSHQVALSIQKKQTEEELIKLSHAIQQSPSSVIITDLEGHIEYVNPRFTEMTGYTFEEVKGKNPSILKSGKTPPRTYRELWETLSRGEVWHGEFCNRKKNGELFWEYASISPIKNSKGQITHYLAVKEDITDRKKLQEQLLQSQKMEAIGKLAGGVAHDFNNILTVINGYADLLSGTLSPSNPAYKPILQIKKAGERAAALTEQLLAFSRKQIIQPRTLNLNEVIRATSKMLHRLIGEDILVDMKLEENLKKIKVDPGQIDQVILNLVINARDAMPNGGVLTLQTRNAVLTESDRIQHPEILPGEYVLFSVEDTGVGMDEGTIEHIFEPFYTTKDRGKGTGLGLSTVYGIIKQNKGYIWVSSEPGRGTRFDIYLPVETAEELPEPVPQAERMELNGNETVLIVEDELNVRELAGTILREHGYTVLEAENGQAALEIVSNNHHHIDLVLTDVVMPGMNGKEFGERYLSIYPKGKIIYMSGYTSDIIASRGVLDKDMYFIHKPFSPEDLLSKIRTVLDET